MRSASIALLVCLLTLVCAPSWTWSQEESLDNPFAPAEDSAVEDSPESAAESKIKQILEGQLHETGLEFLETPLSVVMKFIGKEYGLEIKIDEVALEDLELTPDVPITVTLRQLSLQSALKLMLKDHDLTYIVEGERLLITSVDVALARLGVRVYSTSEPLIPFELKGESHPGEPTPFFEASAAHKQNGSIRRVLRSPLLPDGLDITEMSLGNFARLIREQYKLEVQLDLLALDDLGLNPDDPLTFRIENVPLGVALREALAQHDLTYVVRDGFLLITSEDEALARLSVRVYPVGDLLQPKGGQAAIAASVDDLIDVLISTVASDTWAVNGGGEAEICSLQPGMLIVSQTQAVHEELADLILALRRARQHELAIPYAPKVKKDKSNYPRGGFGGGRAPTDTNSGQKQEKTNPSEHQCGGAF